MANVPGTGSADTLNGTGSADSISGFSGNDSISAGNGNDTVYGGNSSDTVSGGAGADLIRGDSDAAATWGYRVYDKDFTSANGQAPGIETGSTLRGSGLASSFDVTSHVLAARGTTGDPDDFGVIYTTTITAPTMSFASNIAWKVSGHSSGGGSTTTVPSDSSMSMAPSSSFFALKSESTTLCRPRSLTSTPPAGRR